MPLAKGQSGNPNGRPKIIREVAELARDCSREVIARLKEIALTSDNEAAAIRASEVLLERGFGKAIQPIDTNASILDLLDEAEREAVLGALETADSEARSGIDAATAGSC